MIIIYFLVLLMFMIFTNRTLVANGGEKGVFKTLARFIFAGIIWAPYPIYAIMAMIFGMLFYMIIAPMLALFVVLLCAFLMIIDSNAANEKAQQEKDEHTT